MLEILGKHWVASTRLGFHLQSPCLVDGSRPPTPVALAQQSFQPLVHDEFGRVSRLRRVLLVL